MRKTAKLTEPRNRTAVPMNAPSPHVEEGITVGETELGWVRGTGIDIAMRRQPLTRRVAHCLRVAPPSPTGGRFPQLNTIK
jgi:hypothetical protein